MAEEPIYTYRAARVATEADIAATGYTMTFAPTYNPSTQTIEGNVRTLLGSDALRCQGGGWRQCEREGKEVVRTLVKRPAGETDEGYARYERFGADLAFCWQHSPMRAAAKKDAAAARWAERIEAQRPARERAEAVQSAIMALIQAGRTINGDTYRAQAALAALNVTNDEIRAFQVSLPETEEEYEARHAARMAAVRAEFEADKARR